MTPPRTDQDRVMRDVTQVDQTSVTVRVELYAERNPADVQVVKVAESNLTYSNRPSGTAAVLGRNPRPT
jgi:hypothetical protein